MFSLKCYLLLRQKDAQKGYKIITDSAEPRKINCMQQTGPRKGVQHAIVCYHTLIVKDITSLFCVLPSNAEAIVR